MGESKPEPKPDKKRVTLRDVAEEADVSLKTASNVSYHSGRMTDSTREKVQEVIDRLGYRVNVSARNLNRVNTGFITLAAARIAEHRLRAFHRGGRSARRRVQHHGAAAQGRKGAGQADFLPVIQALLA